jgi:hypothetical protein
VPNRLRRDGGFVNYASPRQYQGQRHLTDEGCQQASNLAATALRGLLSTAPPIGKNLVIVSRKPNLLDAAARSFRSEGRRSRRLSALR